jgi:hypothetical protein
MEGNAFALSCQGEGTTTTTTTTTTAGPNECCESVVGTGNLKLTASGGPGAGMYTMVWQAGVAPGGFDGWKFTIMSTNVIVWCEGGSPGTWKLFINSIELGCGPVTVTATAAQCEPFQVTYPGGVCGFSGSVLTLP